MSLLNKESFEWSSIMSLSCKEQQLLNLTFFAQQRISFAHQGVFALEKVIIQFSEFKGKKLIDLTVFYNAGENEGDCKPTHIGLSISRKLISKLKKVVDSERTWIKELWIFEG